MKIEEIERGFQKTVDQYYAQLKYMKPEYREKSELFIIGGICQSALHILPLDNYYALKQYIYERHGYDSGGCSDGQMSLEELIDATDNYN